jgi:hypothetical protein
VPRPKTPLRETLDRFRGARLEIVTEELVIDAARLKAAALRKAYPLPSSRLVQRRDVLVARLLFGKPTLVHRDLWSDVLALALSRAPWQMKWLSRQEERLLEVVDTEGEVCVDAGLAARIDAAPKHLGRSLEARLLILGKRVPRGRGGTDRVLVSWWHWALANRVAPRPDEEAARAAIESAADAIVPGARLPWRRRPIRLRWGV